MMPPLNRCEISSKMKGPMCWQMWLFYCMKEIDLALSSSTKSISDSRWYTVGFYFDVLSVPERSVSTQTGYLPSHIHGSSPFFIPLLFSWCLWFGNLNEESDDCDLRTVSLLPYNNALFPLLARGPVSIMSLNNTALDLKKSSCCFLWWPIRH